MQTTESFGRGRIADAITDIETVPFTLKVSKVPNNENQFITISPDTENEEIFYYTTKTGTIGEAGTLNITGRGYSPTDSSQSSGDQKIHVLNIDYKLALNHIIINEKPDKTDLASVANGEGASTIGIEDPLGHFTSTDIEGALEELALGAPGVADASETVAGKVEIATIAQAEAGTDVDTTGAPLVILPSQLVAATPSASETVEGLVEKATTAEAIARTDNTRYLTPAEYSEANQDSIQTKSSKSYGVDILATENGFLIGTFTRINDTQTSSVTLYTDSASSPTVMMGVGRESGGNATGSAMTVVKKGDYYRGEISGSNASSALYFISLI